MTTKQKRLKTTSRKGATKKPSLHTRVKGHAKHVLVPHKANEYRPHLIRAHGLIAVLIIALLAQVVYGAITTGQLSVLGRASDIQTNELLVATNTEREKSSLTPLEINAQLSDAAFLKAQNMYQEQYWAHVSPSGIQPWKWFDEVGYAYSFAGENLAKNYPTAQATVDAWMNSPTHRENIMKAEYSEVGFAVLDGDLKGEETTLVVALYGAPSTIAEEQPIVATGGAFAAPGTTAPTPLAYFGSAIESLSPVTIGVLGLFAVVALVGVTAHHYRAHLPKAWKKSWRMHHGMYTFVGILTLGVLIIVATGGGTL